MAKSLRGKTVNQIMYITIGCVIAAIILCIALFISFGKKDNSENIGLEVSDNQNQPELTLEEASSSIGKTVEESENYEEVQDTVQVKVESADNTEELTAQVAENSEVSNNTTDSGESTTNQQAQEQEPQTQEITEEIAKDPVFTMPVQGEIVKQYGKEKLIYSDTLKEWTTHLGIDIKADKTTIVKASSDGCIKSIKNDPRYGLTVIVEHREGYKTVYSNLLTTEFVSEGENVTKGQSLGTVGNSAAFEIADEPHLHFEMLLNEQAVDPTLYLK